MKKTSITCQKCGKTVRAITELKNIRQMTLCLYGDCPNCGKEIAVNKFWRKTKEFDMRENTEYPKIYNLNKSGTVKKSYYDK